MQAGRGKCLTWQKTAGISASNCWTSSTSAKNRNHGAADGRVVAGLQVPADERHLVPAALAQIGYPYWDESENPAYQLFLG